jgi:hypothetical protein
LEDPGADGNIILKRFSEKLNGGMDWTDLTQVAGSCECGNEPSGFIKCGEFL